MQNINKNKYFSWIVYFILMLSIFIIPLFRHLSSLFTSISGETYLFLNSFKTNTFTNTYYYVLSLTNISPTLLTIIIPIILSTIAFLLFINIANKYFTSKYEYYAASIIFLFSAPFIISFTYIHEYSLLFTLTLFIIYSYYKKNYLIYISTFLLGLFFPLVALLLLPFLIYIYHKNLVRVIHILVSLIISSSLLLYLILPKTNQTFILFNSLNIKNTFVFFGGVYGYTVFLLLFGIIGLFHFNKNKINYVIFLIIYFIISLFNSYMRIIMIVVFSFLAVKYFYDLINRKWIFSSLVYALIVLVICIIFFSLTTAIQDEIKNSPNIYHIDALEYLSQNKIIDNNEKTFLLTDKAYSNFIEYYSNIKPYNINDYYKTSLSNKIFYSRDFLIISKILSAENISYILIDEKMTSGNIWSNTNEDLLFVIYHNIHFTKIYDNEYVQIYYYDNTLGDDTN